MKSIHLLAAVIVVGGIAQVGEAGLFDRLICRKAAKRCDCDCVPTCQPACCKPVIVRPCRTTVHRYQRQCSTLKPPCCDGCCAPTSCCPTNECCPVGDSCANGTGNNCCDASRHDTGCCDSGCCDGTGCCDGCCPQTCCDLAELIYKSQTGCYARHRKRAIHRMSNRYDCVCHPEVMCALIYALNDADERVRTKAADEIGDQLRKNPCCCCPKVVSALTCALGDCHWAVRWQAKQALKRCGYQVVKQCCDVGCCGSNCCGADCHSGHGAAGPTPSPATPADLPPGEGAAPEAAPQEEASPEPPSAYFQKPHLRQNSAKVSPAKKGLATLLGFFD